jgi:CheY-like chemotaxis protein
MDTSEFPAVTLVDMSLPIMDGWEVARQLKANPDTKGISIVGLSAHEMTPDRDKAITADCDDYDTKPLDIMRLLGKIQASLGTFDAG